MEKQSFETEELKENAKQEEQYWNQMIEKTPRRVIGWVSAPFGTSEFLLKEDSLTDEEYAAILKDIRENKYLFTGEDHQDSPMPSHPVLDDYRYVSFSRRGFGAVMAMAYGDFSMYGYANYMEASFIKEEDKIFPYKEKTISEASPSCDVPVSKKRLAQIKKFIAKTHSSRAITLLPLPKSNSHYWIEDAVFFENQEDCVCLKIVGIYSFMNKNELKETEKRLNREFLFFEEDIPEEGPFLLGSFVYDGNYEDDDEFGEISLGRILGSFFMKDGVLGCMVSDFEIQLAFDAETLEWERVPFDKALVDESGLPIQTIDRAKAKEIYKEDPPYMLLDALIARASK